MPQPRFPRTSLILRRLPIAVLVALLLAACTEPPPVSLNQAARARIDTLFTRQVSDLRGELDSLCEARFDAAVAVAVDSILPIRRAEEARLRQRIPRQQ